VSEDGLTGFLSAAVSALAEACVDDARILTQREVLEPTGLLSG